MTKNFRLRNVDKSDLKTFFENQLDPEACQMAVFSPRDHEAFMAHWTKILNDEKIAKQTILVDDQVVGNIVSFNQFGKREIGYWIDRNFWGQGIATKALSDFLRQERERPLSAHVAKHNLGSLRVLQKCGFEICGEDKTVPDENGHSAEEFVLRLGEFKPSESASAGGPPEGRLGNF